MRRNAFLGYLLIELIVIGLVMAIFKFIPDRQIAATIAGVLFVGVPVLMMGLEYHRRGLSHKLWFCAVLQFWLLFAIPILGMRLLNWGVAFDRLSFLGVAGVTLHQWSSKSYMVMVVFTWWESWKIRQGSREKGHS